MFLPCSCEISRIGSQMASEAEAVLSFLPLSEVGGISPVLTIRDLSCYFLGKIFDMMAHGCNSLIVQYCPSLWVYGCSLSCFVRDAKLALKERLSGFKFHCWLFDKGCSNIWGTDQNCRPHSICWMPGSSIFNWLFRQHVQCLHVSITCYQCHTLVLSAVRVKVFDCICACKIRYH